MIDKIIDNAMYRFKDQVLYKEDTETSKELQRLKKYLENNNDKDLENKMKLFEYGLSGEKQVLYELKHSGIGMYILHNINIEHNGKSAQIDFVVITARCTYLIECKNFIGNISINKKGDFIRKYIKNNKEITESIYNPVTQSKRHLEIIKEKSYNSANLLYKINFEKNFNSTHDYIVVMANPKTIINDKYAPKEVKERFVKADQIIECIKNLESKKEPCRAEKTIQQIADNYIELNKEKPIFNLPEFNDKEISKENTSIDKNELRTELKRYRLMMAKEKNYKPYFIYNDETLEEILSVMPSTIGDLKKISGFGDKK